jgi:molybdopterin converting factor small subunit
MHIHLRLFATLTVYAPKNADAYPITPGTTAKDIVNQLNIPLAEAKLIFINSIRKDIESPLTDGDRVGIFPPVGGG